MKLAVITGKVCAMKNTLFDWFNRLNQQRLMDYIQLMRADKPIGSLLLLWPTVWALWLSGGEHSSLGWHFISMDPQVVMVFLLGVFLMRSAGCVINDFADRELDKHVQRTKDRPLTSGRVTTFEALSLFFALIFLAFLLVLSLNESVRMNVMLAAIPALLIAVAYPFMKRFFVTPQLVLGFAFSCGIPMAFLAHEKPLELGVWLLVIANIAWVIAYDTAYAIVDREDDEKLGILSSARFFAGNDVKMIAALQILAMFCLAGTGWFYSLNGYFYILLLANGLFFVYQQWLIKDRQRDKCFTAFLNNAWFGAGVFVAILIGSQKMLF